MTSPPMLPLPILSVIIPARNAADTLPGCLKALQAQTLSRELFEVIVIDDGSIDGTAEAASAAGVQLVRQPPFGPARARNAGAKVAKGVLLVFTDADCQPAPDFLERIAEPFADRGLVGVKGAYRTRQKELVPRFVQLEYQHKYDRMARRERIDFIDTYAAAYRWDIFRANGGFDETFPTASVEDQELSFRLARQGHRMAFVPQAVVYHRHDRTLGEYLRRKFSIGFWKAYLLRWHPQRLTADTHTPFAQRLQVGLLPLVVLMVVLSQWFVWAGWAALAGMFLFFLSLIPEWMSVSQRDQDLVLHALAMIVLRAAAQGAGLLVGAWRAPRRPEARWRPLTVWQHLAKRALDILLASVGLLLSAPLFLLAGAAIILDSEGPVFFSQERVGEGGRPFRIIKLRTMVAGADGRLGEVMDKSTLSGPAFKIPGDPRVTRVGRFLRRWSLDELPQLWNVLRGEMSLVGPRPEETWVVARYEDRHRRRLAVPPGVTGPMQVAGRGLLDLEERLKLELDYLEHYSLRRDLGLLLRTIPAVLSGKGAF